MNPLKIKIIPTVFKSRARNVSHQMNYYLQIYINGNMKVLFSDFLKATRANNDLLET